MAEEIDEAGFYREDFSTESDFEVFNAQLGEIFQKWNLTDSNWGRKLRSKELFRCSWRIQTETLCLLEQEIQVSFYAAQQEKLEEETKESVTSDHDYERDQPLHTDLLSLANTFGPFSGAKDKERLEQHPLARLYGLRRFVVIAPRPPQFLSSPAEFAFFRSAAAVVAAEVGVAVPIFVQVYDPKWNFFVGVALTHSGMKRTNFDLVALEQSPPDCRYLAGLLSMFKQKLPGGSCVQINRTPATVSVQKTYFVDEFRVRVPLRVPFRFAVLLSDTTGAGADELAWLHESRFTALPHGYFPDVSCQFYEMYTWPEIAENIAFDSALRSDFVPSKAPRIGGRTHLALTGSGAYLAACLKDYQQLRGANEPLEAFVGRNFSGVASAGDMANPLDQLTSAPGMPRRVHKRGVLNPGPSSPLRKLPGPMNDNELQQMLVYLFPDMYPADIALFPYSSVAEISKSKVDRKSAPLDSLVCRLSCLLATCHSHFGGKSGLAQLWAAFTREVRSHWEQELRIPGVALGFPDSHTCLLHQKLQMLNVCLERHNTALSSRSSKSPSSPLEKVKSKSVEEDSNDDDDEIFYDCSEPTAGQTAAITKLETWTDYGRQWRLGDKTLLNSDIPLYVPLTQEPVSKTDDQLHEDAEVMLKLGSGSGLATQMMCASLRSDMEAFKAANPEAQMADFIRWYSPNDWIVSTDDNGEIVGKLSTRMSAPDNTWQTMWQEARPVPVCQQKRLFDETKEALKVLHYLETRTIGEIYELTVVPLLSSAIERIRRFYYAAKLTTIFDERKILQDLNQLAFVAIIGEDSNLEASNLDPVIKSIEELEMQFYKFKCLERVTDKAHSYFKELVTSTLGILPNRQEIGNLVEENLVMKDYVIRLDSSKSSLLEREPQFLRAIVTGESIRLCGAFTENTTIV